MKKGVYKIFLFLLGLLACPSVHAQETAKPKLHLFNFEDGSTLQRISDNGRWAVACGPSAANESMDFYPKLINVDTDEVTELVDDDAVQESGAYDVTDDGTMVVGSYNEKPAVWLRGQGWINLPLPAGWSSGRVQAVTPDGKYAVGKGMLGYTETPVMWNLEEGGTIVSTPGYPQEALNGENDDQVRFIDISADGRYILGMVSYSYVGYTLTFLYDRETSGYTAVGFDRDASTGRYTSRESGLLFIDIASLSPDGHYVSGAAYMVKPIEGSEFPNEYTVPFTYDVQTDKFTLFDDEASSGTGISSTDNAGRLYAATPMGNPVRDLCVWAGGYWIPLDLTLKQVYGIDYYSESGYEYTGTALSASADGLRLAAIAATSKQNYVLELQEPLTEAAARVNLLADYTASPASGSVFSVVRTITLTFTRDVKVTGDWTGIELQDENGNLVRNASGCEVALNNKKNITISFRASLMEEGKKYSLVVPAGTISLAGDETRTNDEIVLQYTGRANEAVKMVSVSPEAGNKVSLFNFTTNPVVATFDAEVALTDTASAALFRNEETEPFCTLNMLKSDKRVLLYPTTSQYLIDGSTYTIQIQAGSITDLTGYNPNETINFSYEGAYVREVTSNDTLIFSENFNAGLTNMMLYDGDNLTPTSAMVSWDFAKGMAWGITSDDDDLANKAATSHSMYSPAGKSDDWMVTPQLYIPDGKCTLTFRVQSYLQSKTDVLKVIVWPSEKVINTLTADNIATMREEGIVVYEETESPGRYQDVLLGDWTTRNITLEQFAGKNVYIAFVNENEDQSAIFVDDLRVTRNQDFIISLSSEPITINQDSETIKGRVTVNTASKTFSNVTLSLVDGNNEVLETLQAEGLSLAKGDVHEFEFTKPLPLQVGESNPFIVRVQMDESIDSLATAIKNLCFEPVKRVTVEEYTGMACPNCPAGIVSMENLEKVYGDLLIPIIYHTYTGDIYESGLTGYTTYLGLSAAPSGLVNRQATGYPLGVVNGSYAFYSPDGDSWLDVAEKELEQYADADINITASYDEATDEITIPCTYKYALHASGLNVNLLAFVTEDNLAGYQDNNYSTWETDPVVKDWCQGGIYGQSRVYPYTFNDVARAYVGTSYLGTGGYVPTEVVANKEYNAEIRFKRPEAIKEIGNCNAICMMLDANTGKYINAARAKITVDGISAIRETSEETSIDVNGENGAIRVKTSSAANVTVYGVNGHTLATAACDGQATIHLNGYRGLALVRIASGHVSVIKKVIVK